MRNKIRPEYKKYKIFINISTRTSITHIINFYLYTLIILCVCYLIYNYFYVIYKVS